MDQIRIKDLEVFTVGSGGKVVRGLLSATFFTDFRRVTTAGGAVHGVDPESAAMQLLNIFEQNAQLPLETALERAAEAVLLADKEITEAELTVRRTVAGPGGSPYDISYGIIRKWHTAYVAASSNIGNMKNFVSGGLKALEGNELVRVGKNSRITRFDRSEKGACVNTVVTLKTLLPADELLQLLQVIEASMGRDYALGREECSLDLDLLLYDGEISADEHLLLPHPGLAKRAYVLKGMAEIAPHLMHPVLKKNMEEIYKDADKADY